MAFHHTSSIELLTGRLNRERILAKVTAVSNTGGHNNDDGCGCGQGQKQIQQCMSRQRFLEKVLTNVAIASFPPLFLVMDYPQVSAWAKEEDVDTVDTVPTTLSSRMPFSPSLEYLLPACRVRIYISNLLELTKSLSTLSDQEQQDTKWKELEQQLLLQQPTFVKASNVNGNINGNGKGKPRQQQSAKFTRSDSPTFFAQQQSSLQSNIPVVATQFNQALQKWGQERQWTILQSQQEMLEHSNPLRAALNLYTNNLIFSGNKYVFRGTASERKRRIRNEEMPDVMQVITSDLDLRDLYRNEMLTAMEDAKAELQYQLGLQSMNRPGTSTNSINTNTNTNTNADTGNERRNPSELVELLESANKSCDDWFRFVPEKDALEGMSVVLAE